MPEPSPPADSVALEAALAALMVPLARLAVARGLPFATAEELLKRAYVDAALEVQPGVAPHRMVSRVSTATGINRREVTRLLHGGPDTPLPQKSSANEVFTRWRTDSAWCDAAGQPLVLPRQGPSPSFEALAQSVTRDVHPRSLLDEMARLGMVKLDEAQQTVALQGDAYVPRGDVVQLLGFLGDNVGDHLSGAVANVTGDGRRHFEQAVFADELSQDALSELKPMIADAWRSLLGTMVPALEALIAADAEAGRAQNQRVRIGLYTYDAPMAALPATGILPATHQRNPEES